MKLAEWRSEQRLTERQVADKLCISIEHVYSLEIDRAQPDAVARKPCRSKTRMNNMTHEFTITYETAKLNEADNVINIRYDKKHTELKDFRAPCEEVYDLTYIFDFIFLFLTEEYFTDEHLEEWENIFEELGDRCKKHALKIFRKNNSHGKRRKKVYNILKQRLKIYKFDYDYNEFGENPYGYEECEFYSDIEDNEIYYVDQTGDVFPQSGLDVLFEVIETFFPGSEIFIRGSRRYERYIAIINVRGDNCLHCSRYNLQMIKDTSYRDYKSQWPCIATIECREIGYKEIIGPKRREHAEEDAEEIISSIREALEEAE